MASQTTTRPRKKRRFVWRVVRLVLFLIVAFLGFVGVQIWTPIGKAPAGERLARMQASPNWKDDGFRSPVHVQTSTWEAIKEVWSTDTNETVPSTAIPTTRVDPAMFATPPSSGIRVTWLGHSTMIIELEGRCFLTDPVWGPRASPLSWMGPKRWYEPVIALEDLPSIDAVVISHDHYDHLDYPTIQKIKDWDTLFLVPLGIGAHLEYWGVAKEKIVELDWWDEQPFGDVMVVCAPARHFSGRFIGNTRRTLWCGFAFVGPNRRAFFSGDTAMFPGFTEIGERLGPFDVTMLDAGAYAQAWADVHMGPEQSVDAHRMLKGRVLMPVHWGLFELAPHSWTEPIERMLVAAKQYDTTMVAPRPGDSFDPLAPPPVRRWWPRVKWRTAEEYPLYSSK